MGLLGYAAKKAIQTAATKSVIRAVAGAAVETIDAVGEAKAKAKDNQSQKEKYEWPDENQPVLNRSQVVTRTVVAPTMAASTLQSTCSKCGAVLRISSDRTEFFCEYCGAKNYLANQVYSVTHTEVDKARIREAESKEAIRIKELEVELERIKAQREVEVAKATGKKQNWFVTLLKFLFKAALICFAITSVLWIVAFLVLVAL